MDRQAPRDPPEADPSQPDGADIPPPVRAQRHRTGRLVLHIGAACVLGSYTAACIYGGLTDSLGVGGAASSVLCPLLCLMQPLGFSLLFIGSRMAPTSAADDKTDRSEFKPRRHGGTEAGADL